jgi:hypothetical protein
MPPRLLSMESGYLPDHLETPTMMVNEAMSRRRSVTPISRCFIVVASSMLCVVVLTNTPVHAQTERQTQPRTGGQPAVQDPATMKRIRKAIRPYRHVEQSHA